MEKIKMGIIGTGLAWERLHYPAYVRLSDIFEINAVCDIDKNKALKAAQMAGIPAHRAFDDYEKMLQTEDIDAVDLMVPIGDNYELAKDVLSHNKHLIAEKPFAASPEGAKELIKLSKKQKVLVAENIRYDEENVIIKNLITSKTIGNVTYFIDNHVSAFPEEMLGCGYSSRDWRQHPDFRGGSFLDSGLHHIARFRFLFGNIEQLFAHGRSSEVDYCPYSCINALLTFENQIAGHYAYLNIAKETQAPLVGLRIFGTEGEIYLEDKDCGFVNLSLRDGSHQAIPYTPGEGYVNELNNFYNSIINNENIVSTPEKELGDIQVINDILKSIETGAAITSSNAFPKKRRAATARG